MSEAPAFESDSQPLDSLGGMREAFPPPSFQKDDQNKNANGADADPSHRSGGPPGQTPQEPASPDELRALVENGIGGLNHVEPDETYANNPGGEDVSGTTRESTDSDGAEEDLPDNLVGGMERIPSGQQRREEDTTPKAQ